MKVPKLRCFLDETVLVVDFDLTTMRDKMEKHLKPQSASRLNR